jgi:hypothetical protein
MLLPKTRTAADYRLQAAHIREFLQTVHDDQLHSILRDVASRLDRMGRPPRELLNIKKRA